MKVLDSHLEMIISALMNEGCLIKGDKDVVKISNSIELANEE